MFKRSSQSRWFRSAANIAVIVVVGTQLGSSCSTTDTTSYPQNDRYDKYDKYDDREDNYSSRIPDDARLITSGKGDIGFRAASNGRMWLYEERDRRVLYYVDLLDGDDLRVMPGEDKIFINGRTAERMSLSGDRVHRIYFDGRRAYTERNKPSRNDDRDRVQNSPTRLVPDSAKMVAEGKGTDLSYKAADDGKLYLYDNSNNVLIQTFTLRKGQRFTVSPANDLATIDGKSVLSKKGLSKRATYRLLFNG